MNCHDCTPCYRVEYPNGFICSGLVTKPERLCDEIRLCQYSDEKLMFVLDMTPDEAVDTVTTLARALAEWFEVKQIRPCGERCPDYTRCGNSKQGVKSDEPRKRAQRD